MGSVTVTYVDGMSGETQSSDVWIVSLDSKCRLVITGPNGPCRYALFTNIPEDVQDPSQRYGFWIGSGASKSEAGLSIWGRAKWWQAPGNYKAQQNRLFQALFKNRETLDTDLQLVISLWLYLNNLTNISLNSYEVFMIFWAWAQTFMEDYLFFLRMHTKSFPR